jgi:hypothetical protein
MAATSSGVSRGRQRRTIWESRGFSEEFLIGNPLFLGSVDRAEEIA